MSLSLRFDQALTERPQPKGIDVLCGLKHFAIITYAVPAERFKGLFPDRFQLDSIQVDGQEMGLVSVVPFIDLDFTSAVYPFPRFTMGQTNYRIYIIDTQTQERCVWFLGTTLDSWTLLVPRYLWQLPWYSGRVRFDCEQDAEGRYRHYRMQTQAQWAPAQVSLSQDGSEPLDFPGFTDTESALVYLTHPLAGFYHRRDGKLGTYRVWHKELAVSPARLHQADFGLLSRLGLVTPAEQQAPYSVLIEPLNQFTIYLPPKRLD